MRIHRIVPVVALLLAAQMFSAGCITMPTIADRVVELATTGAVSQSFTASGTINVYSDTKTIDANDLDLAKILSDAGIKTSDVTGITLNSVAHRVTTADPTASRAITGKVQVHRAGQALTDLISAFNLHAGAVTGWTTDSLSAGGVSQINYVLSALLTQVKGGAAADGHITYAVTGTSTPVDVSSNFQYELRLTVNITGTVKTQMLTGK